MAFKIGDENGVPNVLSKGAVGEDGGECIIKDDVVLRRDMTGFRVQDKVDSGRVKTAYAKIDALSASSFPFGKFLAILKFRT